ncbi:MAG: hypothetical protein PUE67_08910 [Oscillospiraceae bacterium]|nr:hypothetical protein [Oscillospiraceae bacterium]
MLRVNVFDKNQNEICVVAPLSLTMQMSLKIPADDVTVIIPYKKYKIGATITVTKNDSLIFRGIVDEEQIIFNKTGRFIKYVARSMAGLLLDNQAYPMEIRNTTQTFLGNTYLEPFGIDYEKGEDIYNGVINIEKGMTVYDVLYTYCKNKFGVIPRMDSKGVFYFKGGQTDKTVLFSNKDGVNYSSLTEYKKPCEQISSVFVMLDGQSYNYPINNPETEDTGIVRCRYLDGSINSSTPALMAEEMINKSNCNYLSVKVTCPYCLADVLGATAKVDAEDMEEYSFIITELKYVLNSKGEETTLMLERKM